MRNYWEARTSSPYLLSWNHVGVGSWHYFLAADRLPGEKPVLHDSLWHHGEEVVAAELEGACAQAWHFCRCHLLRCQTSSRIQDKVVSISIFSGTVRLGLWLHLWCNQCLCPWFDTGRVKQLAAARSHLFHESLSASKQRVQHLISFNNTWEGDGNKKAEGGKTTPQEWSAWLMCQHTCQHKELPESGCELPKVVRHWIIVTERELHLTWLQPACFWSCVPAKPMETGTFGQWLYLIHSAV